MTSFEAWASDRG